MKHTVKKRGHMTQPAEGYYVDCVCGRPGGLNKTPQAASEEQKRHKAAMERHCECPLSGNPCCLCGQQECPVPSAEATRHADDAKAYRP